MLINFNLFSIAEDDNQKDRLLLFKREYELHQAHVRKVIYWMIRNDMVDDLVQETFLKAWKSFDRFKSESSFKTWIHRIAVNTTNDYFRQNKKIIIEMQDESYTEQAEMTDLITVALMKMKNDLREIFILHYKFGYQINEISKLIEKPEGTVKNSLWKAREIFKECFKTEGGHHE